MFYTTDTAKAKTVVSLLTMWFKIHYAVFCALKTLWES